MICLFRCHVNKGRCVRLPKERCILSEKCANVLHTYNTLPYYSKVTQPTPYSFTLVIQ